MQSNINLLVIIRYLTGKRVIEKEVVYTESSSENSLSKTSTKEPERTNENKMLESKNKAARENRLLHHTLQTSSGLLKTEC